MNVELLQSYAMGPRVFDVAVVIDVLRATTTAGFLLARRAKRILIASDVAALDRIDLRDGTTPLIFSELAAIPQRFAREDNSPAAARVVNLDARTPVLVTTNGTVTVREAAARAETVLLAAFPYLSSVAQALRTDWRDASVALVSAAGYEKRLPRTEDDECGDALRQMLDGRTPDFPSTIERCRRDAHVHERLRRNPALEEDLALAFSVDQLDLVPVVSRTHDPDAFSVSVR